MLHSSRPVVIALKPWYDSAPIVPLEKSSLALGSTLTVIVFGAPILVMIALIYLFFFGEDPEKKPRLERSAKAMLPDRSASVEAMEARRDALIARGWERTRRDGRVESYKLTPITSPSSASTRAPSSMVLEVLDIQDGAIERFRFLARYDHIEANELLFEIDAPERILETLEHSSRVGERAIPKVLPGTETTTLLVAREREHELFPFDLEVSVSLGSDRLRAQARRIFEHFFNSHELTSREPGRPMTLERCVFTRGVLELHGQGVSPKSKLWGATGILEQDVAHITEALADTLERFAYRFSPQHADISAKLATLAHDPRLTPAQRAQATRLGARTMPRDKVAGLYLQQIHDGELAMQSRGEAMRALLALPEATTEKQALVDQALTIGGEPLRRLMAIHAADFLAKQITGERRILWLNLLFAEGSFSSLKLSRTLAASVEHETLLDPRLGDRARGVLLVNALDIWDSERASDLLEDILANLDDDQLIDVLELLRKQVSEAAARAVVTLAGNPKQIDKQGEYIALISTIRAMQSNHPELLRDQRVGSFLCDCLEHEEPQIAKMVLSLLEDLGDANAMRRIATMIHNNATVIPNPRLGQVVKKIHERVGGDAYTGGLSLAQQQGGELTISRKEGSLSLVE